MKKNQLISFMATSGLCLSSFGMSYEKVERSKTKVVQNRTLSEIAFSYIGNIYKKGYENVIKLYLKTNNEIKNPNVIHPGKYIYHPDDLEIKEYLGQWGYDEYLSHIEQLDTNETQRSFSIVKNGDSLSNIILDELGVYFSAGPDKLHTLYKKINTNILVVDKIKIGQKIFHPTVDELANIGINRKIASTPLEAEKFEVKRVKKDKSKSIRRVSLRSGVSFGKIRGENLANSTTANLISDELSFIGIGFEYEKNKNFFKFDLNRKTISYLKGVDFSLDGSKQTLIDYGVNYTRSINQYFRPGVEVRLKEGFFHRGIDKSTIELYKIQERQFGLTLDSDIYKTDDFILSTNLKYFKSEIDSQYDSSLKEGSQSFIGLEITLPMDENQIGVSVYHQSEEKSSDIYKQSEITNGALVFYNIGF